MGGRLLGAPRPLLDIEDLETFCAGVVAKVLAGNGGRLPTEKREQALRWAFGTTYLLSVAYTPGVGTFRGYAARYLELRMTDWYRQSFGDARRKYQPGEVSLDQEDGAPASAAWEEEVLDRVSLWG